MNPYVLLMVVSQVLASVSQILLKKSAMRTYPSVIREYLNGFVITGYLLLGISMVLTVLCYGGLGYLQVIVLEPMAYIMVMLLGALIFHEKITVRKLAGMAFLVGGILVFNLL